MIPLLTRQESIAAYVQHLGDRLADIPTPCLIVNLRR